MCAPLPSLVRSAGLPSHANPTAPRAPGSSSPRGRTRAGRGDRWLPIAGLGTLLWVAGSAAAPAQIWEDPPETVKPSESLTETQRDRVDARTLYTHGRILLQRASQAEGAEQVELLGEALRAFQRAWWFDHDLVSIIEEIVPLAFTLNRPGEAARYTLLAAESEELPPALLERIAALLAEQRDYGRALEMYRQFLAARPDLPPGVTWLEMGRVALLADDYAQAAERFAQVRDALQENDPQRISAADRQRLLRNGDVTYSLLGEGFLRAKRLEEAEAMFRAAHQAKPNAAMLGLRLALIHWEAGRREQALENLSTYFAAKTTAAGLLPYQLLAELTDGPFENRPGEDGADGEQPSPPAPSPQLLDKLRSLAETDPHNPMLGYFLADQLRRAKAYAEAETWYRKLLAQNPTADAHQGLIEIYRQQRSVEPLLRQLGDVVGQTGSLAPLNGRVEPLVEDAALRQELVAAARGMLDDPDATPESGILMAMALLEAHAGNVETAGEFFDQAMRRPEPAAGPFALNFAFQLLQLDQPRQAAAVFERVRDDRLIPDQDAEIAYYLSGAWALARDFEAALQAARQAAELDPNVSRMAARVAWVLFQAERLDEAEQAYRALLERFDADHESVDNRQVMRDARMVLSAICVEQDRMEDAEEWLQQVLDEYPEDVGVFNDLGYLWCDQGKRLKRAYRMVQEAVMAEPDNVAYRDSLGWALYRLGRYAEALVELRKAAEGDVVDGVILDHLGDAYLAVGQPRQAVEAWRRAAEALRGGSDAHRLEQVEAKITQHAGE